MATKFPNMSGTITPRSVQQRLEQNGYTKFKLAGRAIFQFEGELGEGFKFTAQAPDGTKVYGIAENEFYIFDMSTDGPLNVSDYS